MFTDRSEQVTNAPQRHTWFWPHPGPQRFCGVCLAARSRAHITRSLMCRYSGKQDPVSWLQENAVLPVFGGLLRATARRCRSPQGARRQECNDRCVCAGLPERSNHPGRRFPSTNHVSRQRPDMRIGGVVSDQSGSISDDHTFWPSVPAVDTAFTVNGAVAEVKTPFCMYQ